MLGSINIPGFEPKMLIDNYGVAEKEGVFPKSYKDYGIASPIKWVNGDKIGQGTNATTTGFAGYIYANVNRYLDSTPILSKAQGGDIFNITIANTAGNDVEGILIKNTNAEGAATTDTLRWGWTRADNNIYKFKVEYQGDKAKNLEPAKIDLSKFKADLKKVWADRNRATGTSANALGRLVADLYYNLATKDYNLPKYALKFTWEDATALNESNADYTTNKDSETGDVITYDASKEEKVGLKHIVTSEAELVFATIKPLGFNAGGTFADTAEGYVKKVNWTVEKAEVIENKIFDKIKAQIPNFDASKIATIEAKASDDATVAVGNLVTDGNKWWIVQATPVVYTATSDMTDIIAPLNTSLNNVKDMFAQLNAVKEKLNGSTVTAWVKKFTDKFNTLLKNNADQMLQPVLLAIDKEGNVNRVSGSKASPLEVSGEIRLEPTTYTAELFAPAYAKFLGCKDIKDVKGINEIITSNEKEIKFTPEAGKTYEIVYEAMDFTGVVKDHTYYIKGKK